MSNPALLFTLDALSLGTVALLTAVVVVVFRRRDRPSATAFAVFLATLTLWALLELALPVFGVALTRPIGGIETGTLLRTGTVLVVPVCWFWYAMTYSGRGSRLTRRRGALLAAPVVAGGPVAFALTAVGESAPALAGPLAALLVLVEVVYAAGLLLLGGYLLGRLALTYIQVPVGQVLTLGTATVLPFVSAVLSSLTQPRNGETVALLPVDVTPVGFSVAAVLFAVAVWRYPVLSVLPEAASVARDEVVEELQEGVVVVDRDGRILDVNATGARILGRSPPGALGEPLGELLDVDVAGLDDARTVELRTAGGIRQFETNVSPLGDAAASAGRTLVFRDVTERRTREQRLAVLNRVLRHNVRNNVDVVLAHAETVSDADTRTAIRDSAQRLVDEAQKARDVEQMLDAEDAAEVALPELVRSVAERLAKRYDDSEITVDAPEALTVRTGQTVVEGVLTELIENGIEHNDRPTPRVEVEVSEEVTAAGETVTISVADDGPGIPAHERRVARGGTESQHSHGSGLGLWLVDWGVAHLGGTVTLDDRESGGSVVTVALPRR